MKKNRMFDTKGFMLVETLLVSLTIAGILVYMYTQFSSISSSYQRLYSYNNTDTVYQAGAFREFMMRYTRGNGIYTDLTATKVNCNNLSLNVANKDYCDMIYSAMNPKIIILTKGRFDESDVLAQITNAEDKVVVKNFLKTIEQGESDKYRLIILFDDNRISTVDYKF